MLKSSGQFKSKRVVVFSGSGCTDLRWKTLAEDLGECLALEGYLTVNGGGPGLMDLLLKGAKKAGGETYSIQLGKHTREQSRYSDDFQTFTELKPRQNELLKWADAFVALPGGIGTLYEVMEIMALKNTGLLTEIPLILLSKHYQPFLNWMETSRLSGMVPDSWNEYFKYASDVPTCMNLLRDGLG